MQALACLLTPDFHQSNWTDQEVGFALGKGVVVIPVRLGYDPYGFIGKVQGLSGSLESPDRLADLLVETSLRNRSTERAMRKALVSTFTGTRSLLQAETLGRVILSGVDFSDTEKAELQRACSENEIVFGAPDLSESVCDTLGLPFSRQQNKDDDVPF
jgi:hypothetical protein